MLARLGDLARHEVEVLDGDRDLVQIDARDAELLGERAQHVGLGDRAARRDARRERHAVVRGLLRLELLVELRPAR